MGQATPDPTRRRRRRIVGWTLAGLLVVLVGAGVWVATRALVVSDELSAVAELPRNAEAALADGDVDALGDVAVRFDEHVSSAAAAAADPLWRAAEIVPGLGQNLRATRLITEQLDRVSSEVATPVAALTSRLTGGELLVDGSLNVALLSEAAEPLAEARDVLDQTRAAVAAVSRDGLVDQVSRGVDQVGTMLDQLGSAVGGMADLSAVLPGMLGSDGPRTILVMLQNNAELRSGGGITGSFAEIVADGGAITMTRQADSSEFRRTVAEILPVPESTTALYGDIVGRYVQNTTTTPDFDLSARLASTWWEGLTGHRPDIVLAIDPLVLRALLPVTGPVTLAGGKELVRDGFISSVLVAPYLHREPKEQTVFFQDLTERFFEAVMTSSAAPSAWISALRTPIEQGRVSVWSADSAEAEVLAHSPFAGALARHRDAGENAFAVYFNDGTGSKMDSSLAVELGSVTGSCRADGRPEVSVQVRLTNEAPADAGEKWPFSMTGSGRWGVTAGNIATAVAVAAPQGWFFGGTTVDGERRASVDVEDGGFPTSATEVELAPGESALIDVRFVSPDTVEREPALLHTPLLYPAEEIRLSSLSCD
ncbi:DUF4012 domain-containing protein [Microbacterium sp. PA5]|uniref:DUF4012 domain-containing protein n=1 Tax=Microbacterium sp. PA5 TaxID=3416654 RepID=UPI003CF5DC69